MDLDKLKYAETHEWARVEDDVVVLGISAYAVEKLTDIVYVDLPEPGTPVQAGTPFGEIESVKAVSDLVSPVDGEVIERNEDLVDDPARVSGDPYEAGWMIKVRAPDLSGLDRLMSPADYRKQCATEDEDH